MPSGKLTQLHSPLQLLALSKRKFSSVAEWIPAEQCVLCYYLGDKEKQPINTCAYMCIQFFLKDSPKLVSLLASGAAGCWDRDKKILTLFHAR